jgi:hypothetical protein
VLPPEDGADGGGVLPVPDVVPRLSVPVLLPSLLGGALGVALPLAVLPLLLADPPGEPPGVPGALLGEPLIAPLLLVPLDDPSPLLLPHPATAPRAAAMTTANSDFLINIGDSFQSSRDSGYDCVRRPQVR